MEKNILILSQEQPPTVGGAGIIAKQLFDTLTARGWDVSINRSYANLPKMIMLFLSFLNVFKSKKYHKVIINDLFYKKIFCLFIKLYKPKNTLIYLHGSEPEFLLSSTFYKEQFIRLCLASKNVIAVSDYMKEKFLTSLLDHPDYTDIEARIIVIKNGVDTKIFYNNAFPPNDLINIATCCRLEWGKGFEDMTCVFMKLIERDINCHWYIAGEGKDSKSIKAYISEKNIIDNVTFLGALSPIEVANLFNVCHFMLLLSNFKESLGLAYMEASCCGCYSIGRNCYGVKEAIVNGETGALIDSIDEALDIIVLHKPDVKTISSIALKKYSSDSIYEKLELLF
ncbi:glycosyltransferase family 4 protein [Colwellia sp. MB02u-18]|uniref:glycosyltransferase family 4 protein n=1 Tax=unclassified Colwellia TaxID=196834 RepID=UPI0015F36CEF|nr:MULTISPECIES: glycosyltransferase family 4 protein [unclassified Colwellia]MBA6224523.1 glycosyltransferase family 4 protein [Colwellia sp. MB3u-45]MBA6268165.1 glycosyltransferase family 4 protein [Colwellia sp. MB3u-43]MBA6322617.1 glycosyltransferase family 4 protein [Colwellia sp. MB02u-19]MBA6326195.1 glycosyltransferase family 4 protein [Colwellia sp. MB02u-18]MBA6331654.1 glycosyltransferase family 4 protein [Colwellia sp. MB02u-12]